MKKIIALCVILTCLLSLCIFNLTASAEGEFQAVVVLPNGTQKEFLDYKEAWDYANDNKECTLKMMSDWYLKGDTLSVGAITFDYSKFTLDLNGYTIDGGGDRLFNVESGLLSEYYEVDELTIIDTSAAKTGTMTNGYGEFGGAFYVEGILNLNGGTVKNCKGTATGSGAAIYLTDIQRSGVITTHPAGVLNIDGASIINCTDSSLGGAIYAGKGCKVNLKSGTISGCKTSAKGGGVFLYWNAVCEMSKDFTITGCSSTIQGGGVCAYSGSTFNMMGGSITKCSAPEGGGLYVTSASTTVEGRHLDAAKANLYGGSITGNTCTVNGAGIGTYGAFLAAPSIVTLENSIVVYDNTKNREQNNIYLDSASIDSNSVYLRLNSNSLTGKVGITCDEKRQISKGNASSGSISHIFADNASYDAKYEPSNQCFYLVDMKPIPELISVELTTNPEGCWVSYDYNAHIATINIPRKIGDVEIANIHWQGEKATESDGAWKGEYTKSPFQMKFFNTMGVLLYENDLLITNSNNRSVSWKIKIQEEGLYDLFIEGGKETTHNPSSFDEEKQRTYYKVHPNEDITVVADEAPSGMVFDKWLVSRDSDVDLGDGAFSPTLNIKMPAVSSQRFGLKAKYKEIPSTGLLGGTQKNNGDNKTDSILDKISLANVLCVVGGVLVGSCGMAAGIALEKRAGKRKHHWK